LTRQAEPRAYKRQVQPASLVCSFLDAFILLLPGLRQVIDYRGAERLGTANASTLSLATASAAALGLVQRLVRSLEAPAAESESEEAASLDSMAVSLAATRRHHCSKMNRDTVGGGVLWCFRPDAPRGVNPLSVLNIMQGAWHDTQSVLGAILVPRSLVYLMDRGFYKLDLVAQWLDRQVRFIVRARAREFRFQAQQTRGAPRKCGALRIKHDAVALIGDAKRKSRPRARLVWAVQPGGEELILVSDRMEWSAERILETYRKRWKIEGFHRLLKEHMGLAHLYSFRQRGVFFLLHVTALLAMLLWLGAAEGPAEDALARLYRALEQGRRALGLFLGWRPNTARRRRGRKCVDS